MNGRPPVEFEEPGPVTAPTATDGRTARSTKTRNAIADALLDLLTDGALRPTAREIAERASVSVRSVYVHFDDLEDLFCVAAERHFTRIAPMLTPVPASGSLEARARALVAQRVELYTKAGAVGRATQLNAAFSPTLARLLREARVRSRTDLERVFATELQPMRPPRRTNAVAVLDVLTGPDAWQTLRERHDLTLADAAACVADALVLQLRGDAR